MNLPEPERAEFIRSAAAGDAAFETEAQSLVEAAAAAGSFLHRPTRSPGGSGTGPPRRSGWGTKAPPP